MTTLIYKVNGQPYTFRYQVYNGCLNVFNSVGALVYQGTYNDGSLIKLSSASEIIYFEGALISTILKELN